MLINFVHMLMIFVHMLMNFSYTVIGYEPADLTVHPPPQNDREWVHFFRMGV